MPRGIEGSKRGSLRPQAQSLDLFSLSIQSLGEIHPYANDIHIFISSLDCVLKHQTYLRSPLGCIGISTC